MDTVDKTIACIKTRIATELKFIRSSHKPHDSAWAFALVDRELLYRKVSEFETNDLCKDTQHLVRLVNRIGYCSSPALSDLAQICSMK